MFSLSHSMLNLTNLHRMYTPFNFFCFVWYGSWYWWNVKILKISTFCFVTFLCCFSCFVGYSDLNFSVSAPKMRRDTSWHGRQLWEEQNLVINHPAMFKTLFLGLSFAVESKSGIKMVLNLLLLDIIGPKYATLFIRDQLQGVITSQPTAPRSPHGNSFYCPFFWMISNLTANYVFWNTAFIWCSHSPLAEYWVHCVEY